jgi:uncharacterized protein YjbJ (UPF0337 family)
MRSNAIILLYRAYIGFGMSHEKEKGATKQVKGELREAAGVLTDNREMQAKGRLEKTEGKAQKRWAT